MKSYRKCLHHKCRTLFGIFVFVLKIEKNNYANKKHNLNKPKLLYEHIQPNRTEPHRTATGVYEVANE